jgi:hypothetical protein
MESEWDEKKDSETTTAAERYWYTQREWDRVVGWGEVPHEYSQLQKCNTNEPCKETP